MDLVQPGPEKPLRFVSSAVLTASQDQGHDLLTIAYVRAQKSSPVFTTIFEGIDQSIDIKISTFTFRAAPKPIISLYEFVMTTFASQSKASTNANEDLHKDEIAVDTYKEAEEKIRVLVKLASVQSQSQVITFLFSLYLTILSALVILIDEADNLATLSLSTADVAVFLRPKTLRVMGRLGNLALSNDKPAYAVREDFNHILSIDGQDFAEFRYQTFDPDEDTYTGIKSTVYLKAASVKLHFLEEPLRGIYIFVVKLAKLKGLYDAATQVAVQRASEIERLQFEVSVKSPILVFPCSPTQSPDVLVMRLGEIGARNTFETTANKIEASLNGVQFVSTLYQEGQPSTLRIIDDVDITAGIIQRSGINRETNHDYPDNQVCLLCILSVLFLMSIPDFYQHFRC